MASSRDRGETLIEVVLAVAILGITVVAIMGGMVTTILGSDIHRKQSVATTVLTGSAEVLKEPATTFEPCATTTSAGYLAAVAAVNRPAGWPAPVITSLSYWDGTAFQSTCYDKAAFGRLLRLQQITLRVSSPDGRSVETLDLVKRDGA